MVEPNIKNRLSLPFITPSNDDELEEEGMIQVYSEIKYSLIKMGFKEAMCDMINLFFEPQTLEAAITLMTEDNEVWQHDFIEGTDDLCLICNTNSDHLNKKKVQEIDIPLSSNRKSLSLTYDTLIKENETSIKIDLNSDKKSSNLNIHECGICFAEIPNKDKNSVKVSCEHYFCLECWLDYFKEKINTGQVKDIKCMEYGCQYILSHQYVLNIIKDNELLSGKYDKFYRKKMVMNNENMKFCPIPNCEGYGERKDTNLKYVTCTEGHQFCFNCMKNWHGKKSCQKEIDLDFEKWKKNKLIKQCPKCHFWTEKNAGCNHMTCRACSYNWCWLCQNYCPPNHFDFGSCIGLQFNDESCYQWWLCIHLYKLATFMGLWLASYFFSVVVIVFCVCASAITNYNHDIFDCPDFFYRTIPVGVMSLCLFVCFQILITGITSLILIPCLFYWPLLGFILEFVFDFLNDIDCLTFI